MVTAPFSLEILHPSRAYRKNGGDLGYEFVAKGFQFLIGQGAEKRFQHDRCLPHACIQVVPKHFELSPRPVQKLRSPIGNILHDYAGFFLQFLDDLFK